MPRIVTFWPVRPNVTLGTPGCTGAGCWAMPSGSEARAAIAPPAAAAFKKCLRLDPPRQTLCARSLMVHVST